MESALFSRCSYLTALCILKSFSIPCRDGVIDKDELKILLQSTNHGAETISKHPVSPRSYLLLGKQAQAHQHDDHNCQVPIISKNRR